MEKGGGRKMERKKKLGDGRRKYEERITRPMKKEERGREKDRKN